MTVHDPPLVFDIENDPSEKWPLSSGNLPADLLDNVMALVFDHVSGMVKREPLLGVFPQDLNLQPCCNPPACTCNYPGMP